MESNNAERLSELVVDSTGLGEEILVARNSFKITKLSEVLYYFSESNLICISPCKGGVTAPAEAPVLLLVRLSDLGDLPFLFT